MTKAQQIKKLYALCMQAYATAFHYGACYDNLKRFHRLGNTSQRAQEKLRAFVLDLINNQP